jgi:hypothetical protein
MTATSANGVCMAALLGADERMHALDAEWDSSTSALTAGRLLDGRRHGTTVATPNRPVPGPGSSL